MEVTRQLLADGGVGVNASREITLLRLTGVALGDLRPARLAQITSTCLHVAENLKISLDDWESRVP